MEPTVVRDGKNPVQMGNYSALTKGLVPSAELGQADLLLAPYLRLLWDSIPPRQDVARCSHWIR